MTAKEKRPWPTLKERLKHPLTSREEAIRQLQTMIEITPLAKAVLKRSSAGSSSGRKKIAG